MNRWNQASLAIAAVTLIYSGSSAFGRGYRPARYVTLADRLIITRSIPGLELPQQRLRPGAGSGQERAILRALAWLGFEEQREEAA